MSLAFSFSTEAPVERAENASVIAATSGINVVGRCEGKDMFRSDFARVPKVTAHDTDTAPNAECFEEDFLESFKTLTLSY